MLDGTFPPYRHLLDQNIISTAVVEVAPFLDSVRRVALVTDKTVPLRLEFNGTTVSLEAGAGEEAQATEAIDILLNGEPISIAFNPTFLSDGLQAVGTSFVQISFTGSNKPAILMGKNEATGNVGKLPLPPHAYEICILRNYHSHISAPTKALNLLSPPALTHSSAITGAVKQILLKL
jgi:DNA polymerase III sliding clamp (beta) subunit (PCNA family)